MSAIVWIGLLPMMQLFFHVTCSCIIMHSTSFFPSFLCLIFYYVSSFSFLLSLVNFLSMAPKKSIPSKNSISRRGSSSSSSPSVPNSVRFHDEKAKEDFYENFSNRAIHLEH